MQVFDTWPVPDLLVRIKRHIYDYSNWGVTTYIPETVMKSASIAVVADLTPRDILVRIDGLLASKSITIQKGVKNYVPYPKTWWDHFKNTWFPDWLRKYFPVKLSSIPVHYTVTYTRMCPHLPVDKERKHGEWLEAVTGDDDASKN